MIKTLEKTPEWYYDFISKLPELDEASKNCYVLSPVGSISVDSASYYRTVRVEWSGGLWEYPEQMFYSDHSSFLAMEYDEPFDPRQHTFRISDVFIYLFEENDTKQHFIIFFDLETREWYCCAIRTVNILSI